MLTLKVLKSVSEKSDQLKLVMRGQCPLIIEYGLVWWLYSYQEQSSHHSGQSVDFDYCDDVYSCR